MREEPTQAYVLGRQYDVMPIPMDPNACKEIPAGPVTFIVESRTLTDGVINKNASDRGHPDATYDIPLLDGGASIHVLGTGDRLEYLRFDCFDQEPHYHYIRNTEQANIVVRFDEFAEDDAQTWTLERLRRRLPEMISHAGAPDDLVEAVRATDVEPAVDELADLLSQL